MQDFVVSNREESRGKKLFSSSARVPVATLSNVLHQPNGISHAITLERHRGQRLEQRSPEPELRSGRAKNRR